MQHIVEHAENNLSNARNQAGILFLYKMIFSISCCNQDWEYSMTDTRYRKNHVGMNRSAELMPANFRQVFPVWNNMECRR
jgi:hypothetical protein